MISIAHFDPRKHDKGVTNVLQPAPLVGQKYAGFVSSLQSVSSSGRIYPCNLNII
jgi:hypothetical protein